MKVLVLGASGMLGNAALRVLSESSDLDVVGSVRSQATGELMARGLAEKLVVAGDLEKHDALV